MRRRCWQEDQARKDETLENQGQLCQGSRGRGKDAHQTRGWTRPTSGSSHEDGTSLTIASATAFVGFHGVMPCGNTGYEAACCDDLGDVLFVGVSLKSTTTGLQGTSEGCWMGRVGVVLAARGLDYDSLLGTFQMGSGVCIQDPQGTKKEEKMQEVGEIAAKAARQAIKEQIGERRSTSSFSSYRLPEPPTLSAEAPLEDLDPRTPTLRRRPTEARAHPSPGVSSQASTDTNVLDEFVGERTRVARDMISLMTLEEIKVGLRAELLSLSGLSRI